VPREAVSLEDAIKAYTLGAAFAGRREKQEGSLEPGKLADLILVSQDLFKIEPQEIGKTEVLLTWWEGEQSMNLGVEKVSDRRSAARSEKKMMWRRRMGLLPLLAVVLVAGSCAKKTPTLNLLCGKATPIRPS